VFSKIPNREEGEIEVCVVLDLKRTIILLRCTAGTVRSTGEIEKVLCITETPPLLSKGKT
jgi:hypothetical protein